MEICNNDGTTNTQSRGNIEKLVSTNVDTWPEIEPET